MQCEGVVDQLEFYRPDVDKDGSPIKMFKHHEGIEKNLFQRLKRIIPELEAYYEFQYKGTERMAFEWYPAGVKTDPRCDNSQYLNKKWVRTYERDFSVVLFLVDFQDTVPFESDYEVYGGKLSFPQHGFGFNPQRGTMIVYPSGPHFINAIEPILAGDLFQVKFHIAAKLPYLYNPAKFPGTYRDWFSARL
jgi:hypothetical protein